MKTDSLHARLSLLALLVFAGAATAQEDCPPETSVCGCGKQHALRARAAAGLPLDDFAPGPSYGSREAYSATNVISCDLDMEIVPSTLNISGVCTMVVESRIAGLNQFTIVLRQNYAVTGATVDGAAVTVPAPGSVTS